MVGGASVLLLIGLGRIAGVSGIAFGLLERQHWHAAHLWRAGFVIGLMLAGWLWADAAGQTQVPDRERNVPLLVISGLLVGWGTSLGSGCTSGHGVCGLGRLSKRSLAAVLTFMATGVVTVYVVRHLLA